MHFNLLACRYVARARRLPRFDLFRVRSRNPKPTESASVDGVHETPQASAPAYRDQRASLGRGRRTPRPPAFARTRAANKTGSAGARTYPSANGAPCARITRSMAIAGITSRTTTPAAAPTAGVRMACSAFSDRQSAYLLLARALERQRPHSQGAVVRSDGPRREPRRGREGALLLPRCDAYGFVPARALQVSPERISVCEAGGRESVAEASTNPS